MMEGRAGIPAFWMAMTKGDEAAVPEPSLRRGSLEATRRPMMNCRRVPEGQLRLVAE